MLTSSLYTAYSGLNAASKGFVRNAIVYKEKYAPLGDPMEILIHNYHIALRQEEAQNIEIEEI